MKVYGFGEKQTPEPFINACSQFTYVEGLAQSSVQPDEPVLKVSDLIEATDLFEVKRQNQLVLIQDKRSS